MKYETVPTLAIWTADCKSFPSAGGVGAVLAAFRSGAAPGTPLALPVTDQTEVDKLVKVFESARSPMAKRNILVQLKGEIASWVRGHPRAITPPWVALQDVVAQLLKDYNSAAQFTHVICTGWKVGCNYKGTRKKVRTNELRKSDYFAHSPEDMLDMIQKCSDMAHAIHSTKTGIAVHSVEDTSKTLKIFMAPEFYFRGKNGAYSPEIVAEIIPCMKEALGAGWNEWLFVFGTAVASIEQTESFCGTCDDETSRIRYERDPADPRKTIPKCSQQPPTGPAHVIKEWTRGAEVQNVALIYHAGESHLVAKEYVSQIDYIDNKVVVVHPGGPTAPMKVLPPQGSHASRIKSVFNDERLGGCIMNMAGLTIGLEVCLDHITSPGSSLDVSLGRASPYASIIQVLLIPSYGMEIRDGLYCRTGGVIFNVDGRGWGRTDLMRKGEDRPGKVTFSAGRGSVDIWKPVRLPA